MSCNDLNNSNKSETSNLHNLSSCFIDSEICKSSDIKENIETTTDLLLITKNSINQCREYNFLEKGVEDTPACPQNKNDFKSVDDQGNKETLSPPIATKISRAQKLKRKYPFGRLFETDFQNFLRKLINPTEDCSPVDREINRNLRTLDKCTKSFSKCIWKIHKDLDNEAKETQNLVEYAKKRATEREKLEQSYGLLTCNFNQPKANEQTPQTFTIFIEADILPKKAITFETSAVLTAQTVANNNSFYDQPGYQTNLSTAPQPSNANINHVAATTYPVKPTNSSPKNPPSRQQQSVTTTKSVRQKSSKKRLKDLPQKVQPIKPIPLNVQNGNHTLSTMTASYLNPDFNYSLPNQTYNNFYTAPNYYNCWPETNACTNSWLTADEQWLKTNFYPPFQNFNIEPTIEVPNADMQRYQYHNSLLPCIQDPYSYLQPIIEPNVCHAVVPNYLPTYQDIQLRKC